MTIFAIYRYNMSSLGMKEPSFSQDEEYKTHDKCKTLEEKFESFFGKAEDQVLGIKEVKEKRNGKKSSVEGEEHLCTVKQHKNNIIILRLKANKKKTVETIEDQKQDVEHHPGCLIIIDNRKGSNLMVVERNSSAFSDPDKVMAIMRDSFNRKMQEYGCAIEITPLRKKEKFWVAVDEIRHKLKDSITCIKFDFKAEEQKEHAKGKIYEIMKWFNLFAKDSELSMNIGDEHKLEQVKSDLDCMAELCLQSPDYNLTVKFHDFGLFRYGQDVKAQYGIEDDVIKEFIRPSCSYVQDLFADDLSPVIDLPQWFDNVNILFADYEQETSLGRKRNTRGRV